MRAAKSERADALGTPGASARAEFVRRREDDARRRRAVFGKFLAPFVKVMAGERPATRSWERGGRGEERVGVSLRRAVGNHGWVLHDRAIPGTCSNIDHIAVVPSGVWVIDTKSYVGPVQRRVAGGWFVPRPALFVNGRDRTALVPALARQTARVSLVVGDTARTQGALCFVSSQWGVGRRAFTIDEVTITRSSQLARSLRKPGPLDPASLHAIATKIAAAFPIYPIPPPGAASPRGGTRATRK